MIVHSETAKHQKNVKKVNTHVRQTNLQESLQKKQEEIVIEEQTQLFAIDFVRRADRHNIPASATKCLVKCIKKHLSNENSAEITKKLQLGRNKIEYTAKLASHLRIPTRLWRR